MSIAADLLEIGAVALRPDDPFTWSSGMKAPIYCDNRRTLGFPKIRRAICDGFAGIVDAHNWPPSTMAGTATAGIPHAAWLADRLDRPMAYVRSSVKSHGRKNRIEGVITPGDDVLVIEDLISTGGSALDAVDAVQDAGATVHAVLAIFSYELDAAVQAFDASGVPLFTLTGFGDLLDAAEARGSLNDLQRDALAAWRADPEAWSKAAS